jgi:hypothetical protein
MTFKSHVVVLIACIASAGALLSAMPLESRGQDFYVVNQGGSGSIGQYTTAGATINASLIQPGPDPVGLAVSGNDLFVTSFAFNTIAE